ncbi:hypothetical protein AV521_31425 [Streptomyces sp. IMTB 2501]|uniref:hypothetical protein n=1 Tax=Streptomyces sp. IMTB 2501 TaxID=1776340 RepID=UPI00096C232D|nr:hypothetical protein [Streptomyces sp. IMTB 2501]OLZ65567.1 hypothetical protein AV521_31425 [Streptomyces sp. IMTB 2501]
MHKTRAILTGAALAMTAVIGVCTPAFAATGTDSNTAYGVTIMGINTLDNTPWVFADLCNHQGSANSFHLWIKDAQTGDEIIRTTTPVLQPGQCYSDYNGYLMGEDYGQDAIQVYASSGNLWTFGTDPIYLG